MIEGYNRKLTGEILERDYKDIKAFMKEVGLDEDNKKS